MPQQHELTITVGIGASAGGLAVLKQFVSSLRERTGMAFIIVQHLDPDHKSQLADILSRTSVLPVRVAADGEQICGDTVYVAPANTYLELSDKQIRLIEPQHARGFRKSVDHLFCSLASQRGNRCAGVVLSGAGSDGTDGLREIKAAGGMTLAQAPGSAEHASMPMSAIQANVVDEVVPVEEMYVLLKQFGASVSQPAVDEGTLHEQENHYLNKIAALLANKERFNLKQYKTATVQRRISRRMNLCDVAHVQDYCQRLHDDEQERKTLIHDLMINVTDFFRDPEAFDIVEKTVVKDLLSTLDEDEEIRIWVAGCASGEEAYSLAMIVIDALEVAGRRNAVRIFATDIDEHAIKVARRGVYSESIVSGMPRHYLNKYFTRTESGHDYQIHAQVRKTVSFALQNVISDPPFSRMHLISCRNLLIYLTRQVQERVLGALYFALSERGYLLLGSSESLGGRGNLFKALSKKWRVYQKISGQEKRGVLLEHLGSEKKHGFRRSQTVTSPVPKSRRDKVSRADQLRRGMLEAFLPPAVVVDFDGKLLYNHGDWKPYLAIETGEPQNDIVQMVLPSLRSRIRSALFKVRKTNAPISFNCSVDADGSAQNKQTVQVKLAPLSDQEVSENGAIGIVFHEMETDRSSPHAVLTRADEVTAKYNIEQELVETREELQNVIEELETSSEELKASHEEALSTNEELQSANEELEASSEELRSLNEELGTVNGQLKEKIEQLQKANDDVENFFTSTDVPTVFLDPQLRVQRYTPAAEQLLRMGPKDVGRALSSLGRELVDEDLVNDCQSVLQNFQPLRKEKNTYQGQWYIRQVSPYRTAERRVDGVVIVFQDVTAIKELSKRAHYRERQQAAVAKLGILALTGADPADLMHQAVRQIAHTLNVDFCNILQHRPHTNDLLMVAGIGWDEGLVGRATVPAGPDSQAGYTLVSPEPVMVTDLREEKRFSAPELLSDHGIISGVYCVIDHSQPPFGVLAVHSKQRRTFSEDDANFLLAVANMLSTALRMKSDQEQLYEREQQFRTMANAIPQLAWMADESGEIYWFNQRWYDYTGTRLADVEGWRWLERNHPDHVDRVTQRFKACLARGEEWEDTFPLRGGDGHYRWFLSRAKPIVNKHDQITRWLGTNTDITDQLRQAAALRDSENKLRLAMDTNKIGSFEYFLQREETHWDALLCELWGVDEDETPTQKIFWEGVHPEDAADVADKIESSLDPQSDGHYRAIHRVVNRKTKAISWIEASGQTFFENGQAVKMIGMVIDIGQRIKLEQSLQEAVRELQAIDRSKNEFLSILGHELRNPLAALSGSVEILEDSSGVDAAVFRVMKHSVSMMSKLLDDLLDLTRVSHNKITLTSETLDVAHVLESAVFATRSTCEGKGQSLVVDIDDGLYMHGDATRLEQIFCNLLVNASRYTPEGGAIELSAHRQGPFHEISIRDNGVGLQQDHLQKIFDPFFQIKQDEEAASGLGIGLALSKELTALHGGEIWAESEGENKGSVFTVRLPVTAAKPASDLPVQKSAAIKPGLKVLLIEDNEDILATVPILLESLGCEVATAASGMLGLAQVKAFQPDALLIDIGLPDMSGHAVAERLRATGYQGLLIAVSGYSHKEIQEKSSLAGFDHHLAKPARLGEIADLLASVTD